ncbi:uncharacterized protein LOC118747157 [Rhagoletis pomonella]|uniref:uncharacterized protein LOC118747157 n=1 Tax=Rhagoletis pomonella TaxID=28610 RepID=UPI00177BE113|nr:uncharacterized protein LOC118747157 [Rhagoletis pomonella]
MQKSMQTTTYFAFVGDIQIQQQIQQFQAQIHLYVCSKFLRAFSVNNGAERLSPITAGDWTIMSVKKEIMNEIQVTLSQEQKCRSTHFSNTESGWLVEHVSWL